jgi:hypothetical protein
VAPWERLAHSRAATPKPPHMVERPLEMICDDLDALPPAPVCPGYTLRPFRPGDEDGWCACFAQWTAPGQNYTEAGWTPRKLHAWLGGRGDKGWIDGAANLFVVECDADHTICATACCWSRPEHGSVLTHAPNMGG